MINSDFFFAFIYRSVTLQFKKALKQSIAGDEDETYRPGHVRLPA